MSSLAGHLPTDVLEQVLELLPAADSHRVRAVCARWHAAHAAAVTHGRLVVDLRPYRRLSLRQGEALLLGNTYAYARKVNLAQTQVPLAVLQLLPVTLTELTLDGARVLDAPREADVAAALTHLACLRTLHLRAATQLLSVATFAQAVAPHLSQLALLDISNNHVRESAGFGIPSLVSLTAKQCYLSDAWVESLQVMPKLVRLDLEGNYVTSSSLKVLALRCPHVTELGLSECRYVSSSGMPYLGAWRQALAQLRLSHDAAVGDLGVKFLQPLACLRVLEADSCGLTSEGVRYLSTLTALAHLNLAQNQIRSDALVALRQLTRLTHLSLARNLLSGVREVASHLAPLRWLASLDLSGNAVPERALVMALLSSQTTTSTSALRIHASVRDWEASEYSFKTDYLSYCE